MMQSNMSLQRRLIHHDHQLTPWWQLWRQPHAALIRMPWILFFVAMGLIYALEVGFFAVLLAFDSSHLVGMTAMGVPKALAFSVDNFFANGFTNLNPDSSYTHAVAVVELVAGLITLSTLTALVFSRLSSHEVPLRFSHHVCISKLDDGHLFCRFVTSDLSQWLNVNYSLTLIVDEEIEPGLIQRRLKPLSLLNPGTPQLSQTATLTHRLDVSSPIRKLGLDELHRCQGIILALVQGVDETTGVELLQTYVYKTNQLVVGSRFADLVSRDRDGRPVVNTRLLNKIVKV
jgi:hypothetical protein